MAWEGAFLFISAASSLTTPCSVGLDHKSTLLNAWLGRTSSMIRGLHAYPNVVFVDLEVLQLGLRVGVQVNHARDKVLGHEPVLAIQVLLCCLTSSLYSFLLFGLGRTLGGGSSNPQFETLRCSRVPFRLSIWPSLTHPVENSLIPEIESDLSVLQSEPGDPIWRAPQKWGPGRPDRAAGCPPKSTPAGCCTLSAPGPWRGT